MLCENENFPSSEAPLRLLCIVSSMDAGGAETFLMKVFRALDRKEYMMDFCVAVERKCFYEDEIASLGGKIYRTVPKSKNPVKSFLKLKGLVKEQKYKYVLICNQYALAALDLLAARFGGAKILAYRANSASMSIDGRIAGLCHKLLRGFAMRIPN